MHPLIEQHKGAIQSLCFAHKVKSLYVFGSAALGNMREQSDVDLVVSFVEHLDPLEHGTHFLSLKAELEQLLQREVDLLSYRAIKNPVLRAEIDAHKSLLYAA